MSFVFLFRRIFFVRLGLLRCAKAVASYDTASITQQSCFFFFIFFSIFFSAKCLPVLLPVFPVLVAVWCSDWCCFVGHAVRDQHQRERIRYGYSDHYGSYRRLLVNVAPPPSRIVEPDPVETRLALSWLCRNVEMRRIWPRDTARAIMSTPF